MNICHYLRRRKGSEKVKKSFYAFVLTFRGGDITDAKTKFAEAAFLDHSFPKQSTDFEELSSYIETLSDDALTTASFDALWSLYDGC